VRIAFAGTPDFAARALRALIDAGHEVVLVLTQPDRPSGRGMKLTPSPVKVVALEHGIQVDQPEKLRTAEQQAALQAAAPEVLVVAAYGIILPQVVLDIPAHGCLNIHASLLPRWRGAAPIHRAIEAGDAETGITIMQMDAGLDTGDMLLMRALPITAETTTASLHDALAVLGGEMIVETLARMPDGLNPIPQPEEGVTYAHKIDKAESRIDWRRPAVELDRAVRAFNPFPGAVAEIGDLSLKLWQASVSEARGTPGQILQADADGLVIACGEGALKVTQAQKPGKKRQPVGEVLQGLAIAPGMNCALP